MKKKYKPNIMEIIACLHTSITSYAFSGIKMNIRCIVSGSIYDYRQFFILLFMKIC